MTQRKSIAAGVCGLYAISPAADCDKTLHRKCESALQGGARILQYRDKTATAQDKKRRAQMLKNLCQTHGALFIVNDDIALAIATSADGVHLGEKDGDIAAARAQCQKILIGATCRRNIMRAMRMRAAGADYCAFGSVFFSPTKPDVPQCDLTILTTAKKKIDSPIVAIGGITTQTAAAVFAAGADAIAVCTGLFGVPNITATAQKFAATIEQ